MPAKFGTSGLRGLVEELVGETTSSHVRAFAEILQAQELADKGHEVFIGWDLRQSSPMIAADVSAALVACNLQPIILGEIPTPVLAFYAMSKGRASIMVTGSHIPSDRNGIKFYLPSGEISKSDEEEIAASAAGLGAHTTNGVMLPVNADDRASALTAFRARCAALIPVGCLKGKIIGVYEHSTVGRTLMHQVLRDAGAETVALGRAREFVALDTEDVSNAVQEQLVTWCAVHQLDAIVSADGDADRPLLTDENGTLIRGDAIGIITCQYLGSEYVATPVTSSSAVEGVLKAHIRRTRVGSPHVIAAMLEAQRDGTKSIAGFEANGGFLIGSGLSFGSNTLTALPTRDAFLPILSVLARASSANLPLSALVASIGLPASLSTRLQNFATEKSMALLQRLQFDPSARDNFTQSLGHVVALDSIDGCRMKLADGEIVHLRPSGNAPELRIYVEAKSQSRAQWLLEKMRARILTCH